MGGPLATQSVAASESEPNSEPQVVLCPRSSFKKLFWPQGLKPRLFAAAYVGAEAPTPYKGLELISETQH
jgi:hypothetical protein